MNNEAMRAMQITQGQQQRMAVASWNYLNVNDPSYGRIIARKETMERNPYRSGPLSVGDVISSLKSKPVTRGDL